MKAINFAGDYSLSRGNKKKLFGKLVLPFHIKPAPAQRTESFLIYLLKFMEKVCDIKRVK